MCYKFDSSVLKMLVMTFDCFFDELDKDAAFYLHYADFIYTLTFTIIHMNKIQYTITTNIM